MNLQTTSTVVMIRPVRFRYNEQTATNNHYQVPIDNQNPLAVNAQAQREFDHLVAALRSKGVEVWVFEDTPTPETPDSIFPNNWVSFHEGGNIVLYPMNAPNRRAERRMDILEKLKTHFKITKTHNLASNNEKKGLFLEGTGSMVLDRTNRIAYACLSERTNETLFRKFCAQFGYKPCAFHAYQWVNEKRMPIYHTNVMCSIYDQLALICLETIEDIEERKIVTNCLKQSGKTIVSLTEEQIEHFLGNTLQVRNKVGQTFVVMSTQAFNTLTQTQKTQVESVSEIIHVPLYTIEQCGGGSARCMIAEVFLERATY